MSSYVEFLVSEGSDFASSDMLDHFLNGSDFPTIAA